MAPVHAKASAVEQFLQPTVPLKGTHEISWDDASLQMFLYEFFYCCGTVD